MTQGVVIFARIVLLLLFAFYTYDCFAALYSGISVRRQNHLYYRQNVIIYLMIGLSFYTLYVVNDNDIRYAILGVMVAIFLLIMIFIYNSIYEGSSRSLINNVCMFLYIGFFILARLNFDQAVRQFLLAVLSLALTCAIPFLMQKKGVFRRYSYIYAAVGFLAILVVAAVGQSSYGAKLSVGIGGISIQPSEFVKILFVFFVAGMYAQATDIKTIIITTAIAAAHVGVLVLSRDLGSAMIFFITYLVMMYVATRQILLFLLGLAAGAGASVMAYGMFAHVRTRVIAWQDPLSVIDDQGYQVSQSLFAIGSGGWIGTGIGQGMPETIPVVTKDFVFSAISEEMGGAFALCLVFVCVSSFLMIFNISMGLKDPFYKYVALGLGTIYAVQVFVNVGGVTKFIPSTGVTLPLVSYGGSSLLSMMGLFAIVQGLYVMHRREVADAASRRRPKRERYEEENEEGYEGFYDEIYEEDYEGSYEEDYEEKP